MLTCIAIQILNDFSLMIKFDFELILKKSQDSFNQIWFECQIYLQDFATQKCRSLFQLLFSPWIWLLLLVDISL